MIHGFVHHLQQMFGVGAGGSCNEGGPCSHQLFHGIDGFVFGAANVRLALEADRGGGRGLFLGQSIDKVVHDDVGEVHILASRVIEVIAANGKGITIPTEHKSVQIRA